MMDERLHLLLADLSQIEEEVGSMVRVLEVLELAYEPEKEKEAFACVQVFRGWVQHLESKVAAACDELDNICLEV